MRKGWEMKKLGDVCEDIFAGGDVPNGFSKIETDTLNVPIFSNGEKNKGFYGYTNVARVIKPSITISARGTIGYSEIREDKFYPAIRLIVLTPKSETVDLKFLKYVVGGIDFKHSGSSIPQLTVPMIKHYELPLPPLEEQKNIVTILDQVFSAINKAKANAEQNLKNANELFESSKKEVFQSIADISNIVPVALVCKELFAGGDVPKKSFSLEKTENYKIPIIANAVKDNGLYGYTDQSRVNEPSITIAARGSGTGHTEIRYESFFPIVRLIVLIPNVEFITLEFLKFSIQNLEILSSGSAIPQLTIPMIKDYSIPLPSLQEQKKIVQKLEVLSIETKRLEAIYQQKIAGLEELKKSILQKAFNGELITQKEFA